MSPGEKFEDACRDFATRVDGLFGLFNNIAIRIRQPTAQLPWHNFHGKVLQTIRAICRRRPLCWLDSSSSLHVALISLSTVVQVCIVTGGNAGVGSATAEAMVARGARVILACRDSKRAKIAAEVMHIILSAFYLYDCLKQLLLSALPALS